MPQEGVACNHHFLLPEDGSEFQLLAGRYILRIYAKQASRRTPKELAAIAVQISESQAQELWADNMGIYFDWGPDQQAYHSHIERRSTEPISIGLVEPAG